MSRSAQDRLSAFVAEAPALSREARDAARVSLVDSLAVAFAGRSEPVHRALDGYLRQAGPHPHGAACWLDGSRLPPEQAALANAVAVHALDFDDVTPAWRGHPGAVLWPSVLAVASPSASFGELLDAFVLGIEVGSQIGTEIVTHHYGAGWHSTSTIGVLAAAAACARTLRLDARRTSHALGLAAAQSAGLQANFGSMAKPLQAGFAAAAAVRAALLAGGGVEAGDALEGRGGFARLYGDVETLHVKPPLLLDEAPAILAHGIEIKQYANCYATHRAIEAALSIRQEWRGGSAADGAQVRSIRIEGTPGAHQPLLSRRPVSADESRFSVEFAVACALLDGELRLSTFSEACLSRPEIQALMDVSRVEESAALGPQRAGRVSVELQDGRVLQSTVTSLAASHADPAFRRRLRRKVADCMETGGLGAWAEPLWRTIIDSRSDEPLALETALPSRIPSPHATSA
jgi:2-methylcitrate dehydratase PrpD